MQCPCGRSDRPHNCWSATRRSCPRLPMIINDPTPARQSLSSAQHTIRRSHGCGRTDHGTHFARVHDGNILERRRSTKPPNGLDSAEMSGISLLPVAGIPKWLWVYPSIVTGNRWSWLNNHSQPLHGRYWQLSVARCSNAARPFRAGSGVWSHVYSFRLISVEAGREPGPMRFLES